MSIRKYIRFVFPVFLIILVFFCLHIHSSKGYSSGQYTTVQVGYFISESYQDISPDGTRSGYGYEFLQRISDYTDFNYDYVDCIWSECLEKLKNGEIDLLTYAGYSPEIDKNFDYSQKIMDYGYGALLVKKDDNRFFYNDFEKFDQMKVAIQKGSIRNHQLEEFARENNFSLQLIEYSSISEMQAAIENHQVDAIGISNQFVPSNYKIITRFGFDPYYAIVKQGDTELLSKLDQAITSIELDDPLFKSRLYEKYYASRNTFSIALTREEHEYIASHGPFIVAAASKRYPLSAYDPETNKYTGFENAILSDLAENIGMELQYIEVTSYVDRINKVQSGESDIMIDISYDSGLPVGSTIKKTVPYLSLPYLSISRKDFQGDNPRIIIHPSLNYAVKYVLKLPSDEVTICTVLRDCIRAVRDGSRDITYASLYETELLLKERENKDLVSTISSGFSIPISFGINSEKNPLLISILNKQIQALGSEKISDIITGLTVGQKEPVTIRSIFAKYPNLYFILFSIVIIIAVVIFIWRRKSEIMLYKMAYEDELTRLKNIRWLEKEGQAIIQANRFRNYAILSMDVDRFDVINDCYGRSIGDDIIRHTASVLQKESDYGLVPVRVKADHFVSLIPYLSMDSLNRDLLYLHHNCSAYRKGDTSITLHMNFGVYLIPDHDQMITTAINRAEIARMESKTSSSLVTFYNETMQEKLNYEKTLEDIQSQALRDHEFQIFYQPKFNMKSGSIIGAEALVRWDSKEKGFMFPSAFIPLFERNGFILQLDDYVLEETCKMIRRRSLNGQKIVPISVNQSRAHLAEEHYIDRLKFFLETYHIPKYLIELELTETALAETDNAQEIMSLMRDIGFLISIDDFGSGFSSLTLLNTVQFDIMKLDRNFLSETYISKRTKDILTHIVAMAHTLNIQVICEGIETKEQSDFLMSAGCLYAQGFYYSRPVSQADFEKKLDAASTSTNEWVYGYQQDNETNLSAQQPKTSARKMFESFLNAMYIERNSEKALSFLSSDVYIYDPTSSEGVLTKSEFGMQITNQLENNVMPYIYEIERFSEKTTPDGSEDIFAVLSIDQLNITADQNKTKLCMSASITNLSGKSYIETLHISYISDLKKDLLVENAVNERTSFNLLNEQFPGCVVGCYVSPQFPLFFFNPQLLSLFGFTMEEFREVSKNGLINLVYEDDRQKLWQTIINTPEQHEYEIDIRLMKKDGSLLWLRDRGRRIKAKNGMDAVLAVLMDITEKKKAQMELELEKTRYQVLVDCTEAIVYEYDYKKDLMLFNYKINTPQGKTPESISIPAFCQNIYQNNFIADEDRVQLVSFLQNGRSNKDFEFRLINSFESGNEYLWHRINGTVLFDDDGNPIQSIGLIINVDDEKKQISKLTDEARRDSLTGLYKKSALEYLVQKEIQNTEKGVSHAFIIIDMDEFKKVNDVCGHPYGDVILRGLGQVLLKTFRSDDIVARIGGDEFVVFVKNIKSKNQLRQKIVTFFDLMKGDFFRNFIQENGRSLCHISAGGLLCKDCQIVFSCCVGVSMFDEDGTNFDTLYGAADIALYEAKKLGHFRFVFYSSEMKKSVFGTQSGIESNSNH